MHEAAALQDLQPGVRLHVAMCHLLDFILLRDELDSEDAPAMKGAVTHTRYLMQRCNLSTHKTPTENKNEHPHGEGPSYPSSASGDSAKNASAELVVFPRHLK